MRSSSRLFPVMLVSAEITGSLHEDIYQLDPQCAEDSTVRLAVTRVTDPSWSRDRFPVILLHGEFRNRRDFLTPDGEGMAARLARLGFDVWLPEMRGHGLSPSNRHWSNNRLARWALEDLPPVQRFVQEQTGQPPAWFAAGLGATALGCALLNVPEMGRELAGVVLVNPGRESALWVWRELRRVERWRLQRAGKVNGPARGWGPESEPAVIWQELRRWGDDFSCADGPGPDAGELVRPLKTLAWKTSVQQVAPCHAALGGADDSLVALEEASTGCPNPGALDHLPKSALRVIEGWLIEWRLAKSRQSERLTG